VEPAIHPLIDRLVTFMTEQPAVAGNDELAKCKEEAKSAVGENNLKEAVEAMISAATRMKRDQWKQFLSRLKRAVSSKDCTKELLACNGSGIMLAGLMSKAMLRNKSIQDYLLDVETPFTKFSGGSRIRHAGNELTMIRHILVPRLSSDKDRDAEVGTDEISYYVHRVE
jgi:hypothetical protein